MGVYVFFIAIAWFTVIRYSSFVITTWLGLILTAVLAITFKHYFNLGHPEIGLTVVGLIMLLLAYATRRYLKTHKYGITAAEPTQTENFLNANAKHY